MEKRRFESEDSFFAGVLKIAVGVFIGALAALFAYETVSALRVEYAARQVVKDAQSALDIDRQRMRLESERKSAQAQRELARAEALEHAQSTVRRLQAERNQRKADAWARFYRPSESCLVDSATMVCANEHMAAKRRFDAQYKDR